MIVGFGFYNTISGGFTMQENHGIKSLPASRRQPCAGRSGRSFAGNQTLIVADICHLALVASRLRQLPKSPKSSKRRASALQGLLVAGLCVAGKPEWRSFIHKMKLAISKTWPVSKAAPDSFARSRNTRGRHGESPRPILVGQIPIFG